MLSLIISLYEINYMIEKKQNLKNKNKKINKQTMKHLLLKKYDDF